MKYIRPEDIALVYPPHRLKENRYSMGLLYVSAYLTKHNYQNIIVEDKILGNGKYYEYKGKDYVKQDIIDKIIELKPKVIGWTSTTIEINDVIEMNKIIKEKINVFSIIGGPHVTAKPEDALRNNFDAVVIGEGEETALELIKELEQDQPDLEKIKGIAYKKYNNQIIINQPRPLLDISNHVLLAYDKILMSRYLKVNDEVLRGIPIKAAIVMASRGCPYRCTFCACNKVFGYRARYRDFENIKAEVQLLKNKYKAEAIWFADDTMTINYDHVRKISKLMKQEKMYWGAQSRVDLTNEEIVKLMKNSGCLQLDFGVESGSQRILDEIINKRTKLDQVEKAFKLSHKYGIRAHASFMLGLPTETREEVFKTFEFAKKIKANWYAFGIFTPLPGTHLYEDYYKPGEITLDDYKNITFHKPKEKFNKSEVKDLDVLFSKWRKELFDNLKWRNLTHPLIYFKLFFTLPNKLERLSYFSFKLRRLIKFLLNKLGFKFTLSGRQ